MTWYPAWRIAAVNDCTSPANIGCAIVGTMAATMRDLREDRPPAIRFGTEPRRSMAARTRAVVSGETRSGVLMTRETVIGATPAAAATSVILTGAVRVAGARSVSDTVVFPSSGGTASA